MPLNLETVAAWVLRSGLRDFLTELVPALLSTKVDDLDRLSKQDVDGIKEKLSKKAFTALSKKVTSLSAGSATKKKAKPVGQVNLPALVELTFLGEEIVIFVNRAPVLQVWCVCACKVLGMSDLESLAISSHVLQICSDLKKKAVGLESPFKEKGPERLEDVVQILGFEASLPKDEDEVRSVAEKSLRYIRNAFEDKLAKVYTVMFQRASQLGPEALRSDVAYEEYERFRPKVSGGGKGFGEKGRFHLRAVIVKLEQPQLPPQ